MWKVAAAFAVLMTGGSLYETWAVWMEEKHPDRFYTITSFVIRHAHLSIIVGGAGFTLLGYALGRGGN